jgi:hypothetical protein
LPIYRLFEGHAFQPDDREAMGQAFEGVLKELGLKDRTDPLCDLIAVEIIKLGMKGTRDSAQLQELTIKALKG